MKTDDDALSSEPGRQAPLLSTPMQRRALGLFAFAGAIALVWIALPLGAGLLLGLLVGFSAQPVYERVLHRFHRPVAAALVCSFGATLLIAAVLGGLGYLLIDRGVTFVSNIPDLLRPDGTLSKMTIRWDPQLTALHMRPAELAGRLREQAVALGSRAAGLAAGAVGVMMNGLLTLFFMTLTTYFVLSRWERLVQQAELLLPLHPRHTQALFAQFRNVGRHVLMGTVLTGIAQGLLATIGYWITGASEPAFFGAVTALASLLPAVGTMLVWVPVGLYLLFTGHSVAGIGEIAYGALVVVGLSDYVLRPKLVGDSEAVPALLTFVALFGGVEVFGLLGLVLGPVIVTLAVAVLKTYRDEVAERKHILDAMLLESDRYCISKRIFASYANAFCAQ